MAADNESSGSSRSQLVVTATGTWRKTLAMIAAFDPAENACSRDSIDSIIYHALIERTDFGFWSDANLVALIKFLLERAPLADARRIAERIDYEREFFDHYRRLGYFPGDTVAASDAAEEGKRACTTCCAPAAGQEAA